jgi:AraC-type DNA-binding domain-containing proteins
MFSKLIAGFILVIVIISSFDLVINFIYTRNMEREITNIADQMFNNTVNEFEQYFNDIESKLLKGFYIEFYNYLKSPKSLDSNDRIMIVKMQKYLVTHNYLQDFVVFIKDFDYVLNTEGTYDKKAYFNVFNKNESYTEKFWMDEMKKDFMCKIYPSSEFSVYTSINKYKKRYSLPIVLKNNKNSNYILIAYLDIKNFSNDLVPAFMEGFDIYGYNKELIYPEKDKANKDIANAIAGKGDIPEFIKLKNGYIFTRKSPANSLIYCKYYPNTAVVQQIVESNRLFIVIILLSIVISIALSIYIVKKFNNPVKQIYRLIKQSKDVSGAGRDIIDLKSIEEGVAGIIDRNTNYLKDINEKNSMLINYFYQARLKNISLQIDEPGRNSSESDNYAVILIKIHYRDIYYNIVSKDISKGSNAIKEIIQLYLCEQFSNAITFQIEDNQIVSIVSIKKGVDTIEDAIGKTVQKLMTEDEYAYFSVGYSNVYNSSSDLHAAYKKVMEILKYRKFINRTQIMTESILDKKLDVFYFPEEQQKQFSNLLGNARKDESIQLIDRIFDNNFKKEANEFCIYLLYVQVIDCCSNVLIQLYNEIPGDLQLTNEYFYSGKYETIGDYQNRYRRIITECTDYVVKNQKQNDHIIDYVKKYIGENYTQEITVDFLAERLKITRAYLSWYFKNKTGMNLSDYLNGYRMTKACTLLQNSLLKVKDIAPRVGIYSISTFMRLFKQHTGKTPNDYRKCSLQ